MNMNKVDFSSFQLTNEQKILACLERSEKILQSIATGIYVLTKGKHK